MASGTERRASGHAELDLLEHRLDSLSSLPDGGDREGILAAIVDPTYNRAALYSRLLAASPYCSDSTLLSILQNTDRLSSAQLANILSANSPLSATVLASAQLVTGLSPTSVADLGWYSDSERSALAALTAQIGRLNWERDILLLQMSKAYMDQERTDSALWLLAGEKRSGLVKYRAHLLVASGQPDSALSQLQQGLDLTNPHEKAYLDYMVFRLDTLAYNEDSLSPASIAFLRTIGSKEHRAGVWALNLLERATGERYEEEFDPIEDGLRIAPVDLARSVEIEPQLLRVFPNPAGDIVYVLGTFKGSQSAYVELMGMQGERLAWQPLSSGELIYFDLTKLPSGVYTVRLEGIAQRDAVRFIHHR